MPAIRSPIRSPFKRALRSPFDYSGVSGSSYPSTGLIVCDGNSMVAGTNAPAGEDFPAQLTAMISTGVTTWTKYNFGVSGQTTPQMTTDAAAQVATLWAGVFGVKILVVMEGHNDIAINGVSGATAYANLQTYITTALGGASDVIVIPITAPNSTFISSRNSDRLAFNSLLVAGYPNAINLDTLDDRFTLAVASDISDGGHPNSAGYNKIAAAIADKLVTLNKVGSGAFNFASAATVGTAAGTYATMQTTTITAASALLAYWAVGTDDPDTTRQSYVRPVAIPDSLTLKVKTYQAQKYPKTATFAYVITQSFMASTLATTGLVARFAKGGASGATWTDSASSPHNLTLTGSPVINADGTVTFDGVNDRGTTVNFTTSQPNSVYMRLKAVTITNLATLFDGVSQYQQCVLTIAPNFATYAGGANIAIAPQTGQWSSMLVAFNGASSLIQNDLGTAVTGNTGTNASGRITIGSDGGGTGFANFMLAEFLMYSTTHTQAERDYFAMYLRLVKQ